MLFKRHLPRDAYHDSHLTQANAALLHQSILWLLRLVNLVILVVE